MPRGLNPYDEAQLQRRLWNPQMLSGWVQFFDAEELASLILDSSNGVSQWSDLSGNGYHATQGTPANRPIWENNSFFGSPGVTGGTSTRILGHNAPNPSEACSAFLVFAPSEILGGNNYVAYSSEALYSPMRWQFYTSVAGSPWKPGWSPSSQTNPAFVVGNPYVLTISSSSAGVARCFTNGTIVDHTWSPYGGDGISRKYLFTDGDQAQGCVIKAAGQINRTLTDREAAMIEGWAAWSCKLPNLKNGLHASHPFRNRPPLIGD